MLDCTQLTYEQMADLVRSIREELKRRNPIFVNHYCQIVNGAVDALEEISDGEVGNPTSEEGPEEPWEQCPQCCGQDASCKMCNGCFRVSPSQAAEWRTQNDANCDH